MVERAEWCEWLDTRAGNNLLLKNKIDGKSAAAEMQPLEGCQLQRLRLIAELDPLDHTSPLTADGLKRQAGNVRIEQRSATAARRHEADGKGALHAKPLRNDRARHDHRETQSNGKEDTLREVQLPDLLAEPGEDLARHDAHGPQDERVAPVVRPREEIAQGSHGQRKTQRQRADKRKVEVLGARKVVVLEVKAEVDAKGSVDAPRRKVELRRTSDTCLCLSVLWWELTRNPHSTMIQP